MIFELFVLVIVVLCSVCFVLKFKPNTDIDLNSLGRWAVVTGATDGIGKAFSHEVAKRGFNVFLISRSLEKLESNADEIRKKYGVSTRVFQLDFSEVDKKLNAILKEQLQSLDVGLLINNVGTTTPHPEYFLGMEKNHEELYEDIINVNIRSAVNMTRFVVPGMLKAGKGLVINVSSQLSEVPAPLYAMYGGSKAFLTKFSKDLDLELRRKGVHVHVLNTGLVATKLSGAIASGWFPPVVSPEDYAKSALIEATKWRVSCGHIVHNIETMLVRLIHYSIMEAILLNLMLYQKNSACKDCSKCNPQKKE